MKKFRLAACLFLACFVLSLTAASAEETNYKVRQGDTLSGIAKKYGLKPQDLRKANGISGSALKRNQVLVIPEKSSEKSVRKAARSGKTTTVRKKAGETRIYTVKRGDRIQDIAELAGCSVAQLRKMNRLKSNRLKPGRKLAIPKPKDPVETVSEDPDDEELADEELAGVERNDAPPPNPAVGSWNSSDERNLFIRVVKTFLGVPYRYGGSSFRGIDCSAFVKKLYEIVDVSLPRTAREQARVGRWVKKEELEEGDLVFFKTRRVTDHVGIYIGNDEFVHLSSRNREAKIDNLNEPYFTKRFIRGVRLKELRKGINQPAQANLKS